MIPSRHSCHAWAQAQPEACGLSFSWCKWEGHTKQHKRTQNTKQHKTTQTQRFLLPPCPSFWAQAYEDSFRILQPFKTFPRIAKALEEQALNWCQAQVSLTKKLNDFSFQKVRKWNKCLIVSAQKVGQCYCWGLCARHHSFVKLKFLGYKIGKLTVFKVPCRELGDQSL